MHIQDLSTYRYRIPFPLPAVRCVGWLDAEHRYESGWVPAEFVGKLEEIVLHRSDNFDTHVNVVRGIHPCNLCGDKIEIVSGGREVLLGHSEIWIPDKSGWLASPSLVVHYVTDHRYRPPSVFVDAVMQLRIGDRFLGQAVHDRLLHEAMVVWTGREDGTCPDLDFWTQGQT